MKNGCNFGAIIHAERLARKMPAWKFALALPFPESNLHRIEKGRSEPRLGLAMRMLEVLELNAGTVMERIIAQQQWDLPKLAAKYPCQSVHLTGLFKTLSQDLIKIENTDNPFGELFRAVRLINNISQKAIAVCAGYSTRSLISVENGKQEPMLGTALRLVLATGCDIVWFFSMLQLAMRNQKIEVINCPGSLQGLWNDAHS